MENGYKEILMAQQAFQNDAAVNVNDTYSYVNYTNFYSMVNGTYQDYYFRIVRKCQQWMDGYVMGFHDAHQGIFSTRIGASLVKGIANQICGKKMGFKLASATDDHSSLNFMNDWAKVNNGKFFSAVRKGVMFATGLGTSLLKLNKDTTGLWCDALRLDSFLFAADMKGRLTDVTCIIKGYTDNRVTDQKKYVYYLVERRFFKTFAQKKSKKLGKKVVWTEELEQVPYVQYAIHRYHGVTLNDAGYNTSMHEDIRWDSVPKSIRESIKRDYGIIKIGEPQRLPFKGDLGCQLLTFDECDVSIPQSPFGTSVLQDILSYLMGYDLAYSWSVRDEYLGKGFILTPSNFIGEMSTGKTFTGMNQQMMTVPIKTENENAKPEKVQFELRAEEWRLIMDDNLKRIATTIGMSPKTIAAYLEESTAQKTEDEIEAESNSTISFIEIKRGIFEDPINHIISLVMKFYGKCDEIGIRFATPSIVNKDKVIDREIKKLDAGLTTKEDAMHAIYDEDDESQIHARIGRVNDAEAIAEAKEQQRQQQELANMMGESDNGIIEE